MIKTFRGLLTNGAQDTIRLSTNDGLTGYRIVKFEMMGPDGNTNSEQVMQIYKTPPSAATTTIDFSNPTLLGAGIYNFHGNTEFGVIEHIVFDNEVFNQDIYITNKGHDNTSSMNYYLELEQTKLDLGEAQAATLKDMRGSA